MTLLTERQLGPEINGSSKRPQDPRSIGKVADISRIPGFRFTAVKSGTLVTLLRS